MIVAEDIELGSVVIVNDGREWKVLRKEFLPAGHVRPRVRLSFMKFPPNNAGRKYPISFN
jgi:hypothetical protein